MNKSDFLKSFSQYVLSSNIHTDFEFSDVVLMNHEATTETLLMIDARKMTAERLSGLLSNVSCAAIVTCAHEEILQDKNLNYFLIEPIRWDDFQEAFCNELFPIKDALKIIGVTGTNGKTSTVEFIRQVCGQTSTSCMTIGTLGVNVNGQWVKGEGLTTPPLITLRKDIYKNQNEVEVLALEVSSHALEQKRLTGITLDASAWTNFSQDHLDYHGSMKEYFSAKAKVLSILKAGATLYVVDSAISEKLASQHVQNIEVEEFPATSLLSIDYNRENLSLALRLLKDINVDTSKVDFSTLQAPPGRFQATEINGRLLVVDFAHTPHALESLCENIKKSYSNRKLHLVFGCGGDRDKGKRPLMAAVAEKLADYVYVTSDNPRTEDPNQILNDISQGIQDKSKAYFDMSREAAIIQALKKAESGDIIVVAGKGHEKFQLLADKKIEFDDYEVLTRNANKIYGIA